MCRGFSYILGLFVSLALAIPSSAAFPLVQDDIFSHHVQAKALAASCRLYNDQGTWGTGTIIHRDARGGIILTASHITKGKPPVRAEFFTATSWPVPASSFSNGMSLLAEHSNTDLALVRLDTPLALPEPVRLCPHSLAPTLPFRAFTVGCDQGAPTLLQGRVIDQHSMDHPAGRIWELDFPSIPGRSGGALLDEHGLLVGVCYGRKTTAESHGLYQSLEKVCELCDAAGRSDLYQGPPVIPAGVLLVLLAKLLFTRVVFALVLKEIP